MKLISLLTSRAFFFNIFLLTTKPSLKSQVFSRLVDTNLFDFKDVQKNFHTPSKLCQDERPTTSLRAKVHSIVSLSRGHQPHREKKQGKLMLGKGLFSIFLLGSESSPFSRISISLLWEDCPSTLKHLAVIALRLAVLLSNPELNCIIFFICNQKKLSEELVKLVFPEKRRGPLRSA